MANPDLAFGALQKPSAGASRRARLDRSADRRLHEQKAMQACLKREQRQCRYPGCTGSYRGIKQPIDPCHVERPDGTKHRGASGDRTGGEKTDLAWLIGMCRIHHEDYDAGLIRIDALTPEAMNGPVAFYAKDEETGEMKHVASESRRGVSVAVGN